MAVLNYRVRKDGGEWRMKVVWEGDSEGMSPGSA